MSTTNHIDWKKILKIDPIIKFYNEKTKQANYILIGLGLLIAGAFYYFKSYKPSLEEDAQAALSYTQRYFELDSMKQVLDGDGKNPSAKDVIEDYGSTKAGNLARFYAGRACMKLKKYADAINYLEDVSFNDEVMTSLSKVLLGDAYAENKEIEKAANIYEKASNINPNEYSAPYALKKAAIAYENINKWDKALEMYLKIKKDYRKSELNRNIDKYIARAQAKTGAEIE